MDIIGVGELLIDFTPDHEGDKQRYVANPGGAPCNFLTMAAHVGAETSFWGKVGDDSFGQLLKKVLEREKIHTDGLILSRDRHTTLAFVHLDEKGERSFSFYRKGSADVDLRLYEVDLNAIDDAKCVHFGSLSFTDEPSRTTVLHIVSYAKDRGKWISYDPNYRPSLWDTEEEAKNWMAEGLDYADIVKVSLEELELLTGQKDLMSGCEILLRHKIKLIFVTLGEKGVFYYTKDHNGYVEGFRSQVIDTTGAGDTFFGAAVSQLLLRRIDLDHIDEGNLREILRYANCAASICVERFGGIPAIPTDEEVNHKLLEEIHA